MGYTNGRIMLVNGRLAAVRLANDDCVAARRCVCGFCTAHGQCGMADCRNVAATRCHALEMCQRCHESGLHRMICAEARMGAGCG